jgi:hypothetical protein
MVAEGIEYTRRASPLHTAPTPQIRAAFARARTARAAK